MMKLYKTNDLFNKSLYVSCLEKIGVKAVAVDNGVMIDMEAYKQNYHAYNAPHMVYMNHKWVKQLY